MTAMTPQEAIATLDEYADDLQADSCPALAGEIRCVRNTLSALVQRVGELEADVEHYRRTGDQHFQQAMKNGAAANAAEQRCQALEKAGKRVTDAFRARGEAQAFTECLRTQHECEAAMVALDALLNPPVDSGENNSGVDASGEGA